MALHPLSVVFLGTSSCTPEKEGNTASMLVDGRTVIDAGWYLTDRLLAAAQAIFSNSFFPDEGQEVVVGV